ncbi:MAG: Bug family tripartite tricarboxylate transporter substrate binding protein [Rhodospirillaceae bacterium]
MLLLALPAIPSTWAQTWPQKPVRIIVPFPAGGSNDALCRIVADRLASEWKQPVVVDNKGGAGGNIGAETVFNAPPDGYTLLCSPPGPLAINHNLYKRLGYDWSKFVPVSVLARSPNVITARKDLPANTARELIDWARANPGKVTYASQGNGSTAHLAAQMLATQAGLELVHVPYKGESPALGDVVAGRVDIFLGTISASLRFARSGQVKYLGIAASSRSPVAPDVPAAPEIGLPNLLASAWFAIVAPPGTPEAVVQ